MQERDYVSNVTVSADEVPGDVLRPVLATQEQDVAVGLETNATLSHGKAAFVERPLQIGEQKFNFVQWKGVGPTWVSRDIVQRVQQRGGKVDVLHQGSLPLAHIETSGAEMVRFVGGAFYEDLLVEAEQSAAFEAAGVRTPKVLATMKFTSEAARRLGLPLPENDQPGDARGQSMAEILRAQAGLDAATLERLSKTHEVTDYASAILGENIRAFRNVWRVEDVEAVLKAPASPERDAQLSRIVSESRSLLDTEFGSIDNDKKFVVALSRLLGEQAATLVRNDLVHGALDGHKQDVTLAGEVCDFDQARKLDASYFGNEKNRPPWARAGDDKDWRGYEQLLRNRQVYLLAVHARPVLEAVQSLGTRDVSEEDVADTFAKAISDNLPGRARRELQAYLVSNAQEASAAGIAGKSVEVQKNLQGYDSYLGKVRAALLKAL